MFRAIRLMSWSDERPQSIEGSLRPRRMHPSLYVRLETGEAASVLLNDVVICHECRCIVSRSEGSILRYDDLLQEQRGDNIRADRDEP